MSLEILENNVRTNCVRQEWYLWTLFYSLCYCVVCNKIIESRERGGKWGHVCNSCGSLLGYNVRRQLWKSAKENYPELKDYNPH